MQVVISYIDKEIVEAAQNCSKQITISGKDLVKAGYKQAMSEDVKPDLESSLIS